MSDIRIVRRRSRAHIKGISKTGCLWIIDNLEGDVEVVVQVQADLAEDVATSMREDGLNVEVQ